MTEDVKPRVKFSGKARRHWRRTRRNQLYPGLTAFTDPKDAAQGSYYSYQTPQTVTAKIFGMKFQKVPKIACLFFSYVL